MLALAFACSGPDPLEEAKRLQAQGQFAASIAPLRVLLDERPDDAQVNYLYGRALTATGQPSLAEWSLRKAAEDPEWLGPAGTQLASSALQIGNFDTAIELATRVLEQDPENFDAMLVRAKAYAHSRLHSQEAFDETTRILEIDPTSTEAMEPRILALLALERIDEAEKAIEELGRLIDENEDSSEWIRGWHCATTALFASDSGEKDLARERFDDCLTRFPGHSNVVTSALGFFDGQGDYTRSLAILEAALAVEPDSLDMRRRLALRTLYQSGKEEAERILLEGVEIAEPGRRAAALQILAKHYQDNGDHDQAVATMKRAIDAQREQGQEVLPQLLFDYADALVLQGDYDEALAVAEQTTLPAHREMIRARVAQERGDHPTALAHYDEAFRLWPDNPWARYLAARSAEAVGDFDRAVELYRYSIRIDTGATDARHRLARLLLAEGKPTEALAILQLDWTRSPPSYDEQILALELTTWAGDHAGTAGLLERLAQHGAQLFGPALVALGTGTNKRLGAGPASQVLDRYRAADLNAQDPARPVALHALIDVHAEAGTVAKLEKTVRELAKKHADSTGAQTALGYWLERSGAPPAETRAAYEQGLALDAENPLALAGLARLSAKSDPETALALFDRAAKADPKDAVAPFEAARQLQALGRADDAATRLGTLIEQHPYSVPALMLLVELQLDADRASEQTESLAQRAVRFQGGAPALDLLARVYRARDDTVRATETEARARALRSALDESATPQA